MEMSAATPEEMALTEVQPKSKYTGTVNKITLAGAIVDIGLDTPGVIHISQLQKDPVNRVEDVVEIGQSVEVWVRRVVPQKGRIELTMIEPLDLEWREIEPDMVLKGKVVRLEKFGAFVDVGAERPGLVHISELAHGYVKDPSEIVKDGDEVEVKVLSVSRRKKQIKLSMKALAPEPEAKPKAERGSGSRSPRRPTVEIEEAPEPPVPTAMEMALREAMERSKQQTDEENLQEKSPAKAKSAASNQELEDILSRTLQNKVKTGK
jgi:predicted RNA-binding protein with RPS1 domain